MATQNIDYRDERCNMCGIADSGTYKTYYNKMLKSVYENGGFWIQRYEDGTVNITCANAQIKAGKYAPDTTKTSSLLFGIQWDLVCKYLEGKEGLTTADLITNSGSWGRYNDTSKGLPLAGLDRNKKMNIYDLAGNYSEWTLEQRCKNAYPNIFRGGSVDQDAVRITSPAPLVTMDRVLENVLFHLELHFINK